MSVRYWLYAIALGGCLIASTPLVAQQVDGVNQPGGTNATSAQENPEPPSEAEPTPRRSTLQDAINRVGDAIESVASKPEPADQRERAEKDLSAQSKMADWAEKMGWIAGIQATLTLLTLIFIWQTLRYTADQANAANISAEQAIHATEAAQAAVESAERTSVAQLRAYLTINSGGVNNVAEKQIPEGFIEILNTGQTPAKNVAHVVGVEVADYPPPLDFDFSIDWIASYSRSVIGPGTPMKGSALADAPLTASDLEKLKNGESAVYVWAEIRYFDGFHEQDRVTHYRAFCTSTNIKGKIGFISPMPDGNDYT